MIVIRDNRAKHSTMFYCDSCREIGTAESSFINWGAPIDAGMIWKQASSVNV